MYVPEDLMEDWETANKSLLCGPSGKRTEELRRVIELCERIGKLELFRDEAEAILDGELRTDWADDYQIAYSLLQSTKEYE
jgi:hypothetical protein